MFLLSALAGACFAQSSGEIARNVRNTLSALDQIQTFSPADTFAGSSPADPDLGEQLMLTRKGEYRPFNVNAGFSTMWTSNAYYTPSNPVGDVIMSAFAEGVALPHLGNNYYLEAAGAIRGYRYFLNPGLDFNSLEASAGFLKVFREFADVGLYARYEYTLLFGRDTAQILDEHSLVAGLRKTFQFSRAHALFVSAEADFCLGGEPGYALAHEFTLFAAHQIEWSRWFQTSLFYQMGVFSFLENGRADFRNSLGLSAGVKPFKWLTVSAVTWLGWNSSNESEYDFFAANLGGGINASINF